MSRSLKKGHPLPICLFALVLVGSAFGGHGSAQTIVGRLIDGESMQPIPFAVLRLLNLEEVEVGFSASDQTGDFVLDAPGPGRYFILAEAFSYHSVQDGPVSLGPSDTLGVQFFIPPDPEVMDPILIVATPTERRLRMVGFYRRMERQMGEFLTREEIEDTRAHDLSGVLAMVPGMVLRPARDGRLVAVFLRGQVPTSLNGGMRCYPAYYIDGVRIQEGGSEIDHYVHPSNIEAIEAYVSRGETPAQYRDIRNRCGTILIWTRK
jgi:hypothetical protein